MPTAMPDHQCQSTETIIASCLVQYITATVTTTVRFIDGMVTLGQHIALYEVYKSESKDHERLERSDVDVDVILLFQQADNRRLMTQALQH